MEEWDMNESSEMGWNNMVALDDVAENDIRACDEQYLHHVDFGEFDSKFLKKGEWIWIDQIGR